MEFKYPVAQADGKEYKASEIYGKLANENTGYYLLSVNQFWHGGVHFTSDNFSHCVKDTPVQAIAEGTVIAYRINEKYLLIADDKVVAIPPEEAGYQYGTGFCLIKHEYKSSANKPAPTNQEKNQQWQGRTIVLAEGRNGRNVESLKLTENSHYVVTLPKDTELEVLSVSDQLIEEYYFAKVKIVKLAADIKVNNKGGTEVTVSKDTELYIAFSEKGGAANSKLYSEKDTAERWQDRLVVLKTATESYKDVQKTVLATLPAETKVQLLEASNTTGAPTKAKLLYDVNVTPDSTVTILKKDQELWINLFDDKGQVTQQNNKPTAEETHTADKEQYNFTFYSLYMHLCAYSDYIAKPEEQEEDKTETITVTATNLTIREKHRDEADSTVIGKINKDATLEVLETKTSGEYTDIKGKILTGEVKSGTTVVAKKDDVVWVPSKKGNNTYTKVNAKPAPKEMTRPSYWEGTVTAKVKKADGLKIWKKLESDELKEPVGDLNVGNEFTFDSTQVKIITHSSKRTMVAECTPVGTLTFRGNGEQVDKFWTIVDKDSITREKVTPTSFNTVIPCNAKVTAGEALGYLGVFQTPSLVCEIVKKRQVHVEVFTTDPMMVDFLLNNPLGLKDGRQFIKLPAGTGLFASPTPAGEGGQPQQAPNDPAGGGQPQQVPNGPAGGGQPQQAPNGPAGGGQPQQTPNGPAGGGQPQQVPNGPAGGGQPQQAPVNPAVQARSTTPSYTLERDHIFAIDDLTLEKDPDGTEWYQIAAEQHSGGVKKTATAPEVISQYEWKKLGFQEVKENNPSADGYLDPQNMPAIFQEIYNKIDTGDGNGSNKPDGKLQQSELKVALKDQEIRDQWSKLIAYHPSEWKKDTAPLLARFEQLLTPPDDVPEEKKAEAKKLLEQEKERMTKLVFLEDITPSVPVLLYHFHPVTFVEYLKGDGVIAYHIYHDGRIEKHIPSSISSANKGKYLYIYHDKDNKEHNMCTCEWHVTKKKKLGTASGNYNYPGHGTVLEAKAAVNEDSIEYRAKYTNGDIHEWIKPLAGVSIYQRLTLVNGDIAEYGHHDTLGDIWRLYQQQTADTELVRMPDSLNYSNGDVVIKYELQETYRKYTHPSILAGFIGALADIKENIIVTGSAYEQGSCFPSALHVNGESIDNKYIKNVNSLSNWDKDKAFVRALAKFHFQKFRIGSSMLSHFSGITGCVNGGTLHNSHLHTENFDFNAVKTVQDGEAGATKLSSTGRNFLKGIESLRLKPYNDQTGAEITSHVEGATIGYGHLISANEWDTYKDGITEAQAETLFDTDTAPYENIVASTINKSLKAHEFDALVMFAFNTGLPANFPTTSVSKLINDPNATTPYNTVDDAWKAWNKSQGVVNNGLINRRAAELKIYHEGIYERW